MCFLIDHINMLLKGFSVPVGTKKVVYFYGSSIVMWSNSGDKTRKNRVHVGPYRLFCAWLLGEGNFLQVQIPDGRLSYKGRSSVPSSFVNEFLSLCALALFKLLILFIKL